MKGRRTSFTTTEEPIPGALGPPHYHSSVLGLQVSGKRESRALVETPHERPASRAIPTKKNPLLGHPRTNNEKAADWAPDGPRGFRIVVRQNA